MCTSLSLGSPHLFGRNLDLDVPFPAQPTLTPRNFPLSFRKAGNFLHHYSFFGMATVVNGYPLYADAVNEKGLGMAGLNFPQNACYAQNCDVGKHNVSPFELIPWVLAQCATCDEAKRLLKSTNLVHLPFSQSIALTPLHWHVADASSSIVFERTSEGAFVYDNPYGVLANNPPFPEQIKSAQAQAPLFLAPMQNGRVEPSFPGDFSSPSRFLRAAILRALSPKMTEKRQAVAQFFDILSSVSPVSGAVITERGAFQETLYSCCLDFSTRTCYLRQKGDPHTHVFSYFKAQEDSRSLLSLTKKRTG